MATFLSILATSVALFTLIVVIIQTRLLRKDIETSNYQDLLGRIFSVRDSAITHPELGKMFEDNPELKPCLDRSSVSVQEFFWLLKYLTVLENFYYQREKRVMSDQTWSAYVSKVRLVFKTPKIRKFWEEFRELGTYRRDWVDFVDAVCKGKEIKDPILPRWKRILRG